MRYFNTRKAQITHLILYVIGVALIWNIESLILFFFFCIVLNVCFGILCKRWFEPDEIKESDEIIENQDKN